MNRKKKVARTVAHLEYKGKLLKVDEPVVELVKEVVEVEEVVLEKPVKKEKAPEKPKKMKMKKNPRYER
jgi:hypothetical protein